MAVGLQIAPVENPALYIQVVDKQVVDKQVAE